MTLDVVKQTEVLARILDGDDVHEAGEVGFVSAGLAISGDADEAALLDDRGDFTAGQCVLQAVAEEDGEGIDLRCLCKPGDGRGAYSQYVQFARIAKERKW